MAIVGSLRTALSLVGNLHPVPNAPYDHLPYGLALYMLIGFAWLVVLRRRMPQVPAAHRHDLEGVVSGAK